MFEQFNKTGIDYNAEYKIQAMASASELVSAMIRQGDWMLTTTSKVNEVTKGIYINLLERMRHS